jgi:hypothetical protein
MTSRSQASLVLLPLLLWGAPSVAAGDPTGGHGNFELDPLQPGRKDVPEPTERLEGAVTLPPWPRDADLIAFVPDGPQTPFRFFIDGKSLRIDQAGNVVRYTLVVEASSGTRNLSYEGIHCTLKGGYKVYAYGSGSGGRFVKAPDADWRPLEDAGPDAYRYDLHRFRLCVPRETQTRPLKDILRALRGRGAVGESSGFQAN